MSIYVSLQIYIKAYEPGMLRESAELCQIRVKERRELIRKKLLKEFEENIEVKKVVETEMPSRIYIDKVYVRWFKKRILKKKSRNNSTDYSTLNEKIKLEEDIKNQKSTHYIKIEKNEPSDGINAEREDSHIKYDNIFYKDECYYELINNTFNFYNFEELIYVFLVNIFNFKFNLFFVLTLVFSFIFYVIYNIYMHNFFCIKDSFYNINKKNIVFVSIFFFFYFLFFI